MLSPTLVQSLQNTKGVVTEWTPTIGNKDKPIGEFVIGYEVARGNDANVFSAMWCGKPCVCKITPVLDATSKVYTEYTWLRTFRPSYATSSKIVPLPIAAVDLKTHTLLFVEAQDRSLADLHTENKSWFTQDVCKKICGDLMRALRVLHVKNCMYGELKPNHIMIGYQGEKDTLVFADISNVDSLNTSSQYKGNLFTCSVASHLAQPITVESELESLAYLIAWLYEGLPWHVSGPLPQKGIQLRYMRNLVLHDKNKESLFQFFPVMRQFLDIVKSGEPIDYDKLLALMHTDLPSYPWSGNAPSFLGSEKMLTPFPLDIAVHYYRTPPDEEPIPSPNILKWFDELSKQLREPVFGPQ